MFKNNYVKINIILPIFDIKFKSNDYGYDTTRFKCNSGESSFLEYRATYGCLNHHP